tara:strand:- start:1606 stop:2790 length:1185 start_codon:yes stop_codon:yes gene_type:complete
MMQKTVYSLEVSNLSKKYNLGIRNFSDIIQRILLKKPGKYHWALKNATFKIPSGEIVGVIGPNGAGKSTLLKILSKITTQTSGSYRTVGKVASLLEAGVGFHPEYTGVENIILQGAYLGMNLSQVKEQLPEIIAFAGVEKYANTPVKRYSSGMSLRLATAAALFLDADILLLDEILSVADVAFRRQYSENLDNLSKSKNKTVLFVSHNHDLLQQNCDSGILVCEGKASYFDNFENCLNSYYKMFHEKSATSNLYPVTFKNLNYHYQVEEIDTQTLTSFSPFNINICYKVVNGYENLSFGLALEKSGSSISLDPQTEGKILSNKLGNFTLSLQYPYLPCNPGEYNLRISIWNGSNLENVSPSAIPVKVSGFPISGPGQNVGFRIPSSKLSTSFCK